MRLIHLIALPVIALAVAGGYVTAQYVTMQQVEKQAIASGCGSYETVNKELQFRWASLEPMAVMIPTKVVHHVTHH